MTNIVDFNNSDGLPPEVIKKLNNNFWHAVNKIVEDQIVAVAGETAPDPRTDETLWYKTDTGDLYVWAEALLPGGQTEWGWMKIDLNLIHSEDSAPVSDEQTHGEVFWYDTSSHEFYLLTGSTLASLPVRWVSLEMFVYQVALAMYSSIISQYTKNSWLALPGFTDAVKEVHTHPNDY